MVCSDTTRETRTRTTRGLGLSDDERARLADALHASADDDDDNEGDGARAVGGFCWRKPSADGEEEMEQSRRLEKLRARAAKRGGAHAALGGWGVKLGPVQPLRRDGTSSGRTVAFIEPTSLRRFYGYSAVLTRLGLDSGGAARPRKERARGRRGHDGGAGGSGAGGGGRDGGAGGGGRDGGASGGGRDGGGDGGDGDGGDGGGRLRKKIKANGGGDCDGKNGCNNEGANAGDVDDSEVVGASGSGSGNGATNDEDASYGSHDTCALVGDGSTLPHVSTTPDSGAQALIGTRAHALIGAQFVDSGRTWQVEAIAYSAVHAQHVAHYFDVSRPPASADPHERLSRCEWSSLAEVRGWVAKTAAAKTAATK